MDKLPEVLAKAPPASRMRLAVEIRNTIIDRAAGFGSVIEALLDDPEERADTMKRLFAIVNILMLTIGVQPTESIDTFAEEYERDVSPKIQAEKKGLKYSS